MDEILLLDQLTGLVHDYKGTMPGGIGSEGRDIPIGVIDCGCDGVRQSFKTDHVVVIDRETFERSIYEAAPCLLHKREEGQTPITI